MKIFNINASYDDYHQQEDLEKSTVHQVNSEPAGEMGYAEWK